MKEKINIKDIIKYAVNYTKDFPIYVIINFLAFLFVLFAFFISALLALLLIIIWLLGIILFIKTGGYEKMVQKKKGIKPKTKLEKKKN